MKSEKRYETIADIAYLAGHYGYYSGDSRTDMELFVELSKEFEEKFDCEWGVDHDYMDEIEKFAKEKLHLVNKLDITPESAETKWDNIEIEACVDDGVSIDRPLKGQEPDFWSVYLHQIEGGVQCIADLPTQELAEKLRKLIENVVKTFIASKESKFDLPELKHKI